MTLKNYFYLNKSRAIWNIKVLLIVTPIIIIIVYLIALFLGAFKAEIWNEKLIITLLIITLSVPFCVLSMGVILLIAYFDVKKILREKVFLDALCIHVHYNSNISKLEFILPELYGTWEQHQYKIKIVDEGDPINGKISKIEIQIPHTFRFLKYNDIHKVEKRIRLKRYGIEYHSNGILKKISPSTWKKITPQEFLVIISELAKYIPIVEEEIVNIKNGYNKNEKCDSF